MAVQSQAAGKWPGEPMTYEEFLAAAGEETHAEWVNGKVVIMSPVSLAHAQLTLSLITTISYHVSARKLGTVCGLFQMKTGAKLPGREPDILFVANQNLDRFKNVFLDGPADLVVEIVSRDTRARDRGEKFYEYEEGGVKEYWLIDQPRKQAEFFKIGSDGLYERMEIKANGRFESAVLSGFSLHVGWLWEDPLPGLPDILERWHQADPSNPFRSGHS